MAQESIGSNVNKAVARIAALWSFFFLLNTSVFVYYLMLEKKDNFIREQVSILSEIDAEATSILYFSTQNTQNAKPNFPQTLLNSWMETVSQNYIKSMPNSKAEVVLLGALGEEFYKEAFNEKNSPVLIQKYQNLSDQIILLKRMATSAIDSSFSATLSRVFLPISSGLFLIFLVFSLFIGFSLRKNLISEIAGVLDDMWKELKLMDQPADSNSHISSIFYEKAHELNNYIASLSTQIGGIKNTLLQSVDHEKPTITQDLAGDTDTREKIIYIQKLLSRLFTRAERSVSLAKASADNGFQAGILALNISIEAARSGESGRAFLSVSDRVKDFAEKSTNIGDAIMEELKDADLSIRKAYAVGKNILETLTESNPITLSEIKPFPIEPVLSELQYLSDNVSKLRNLSATFEHDHLQPITQDFSEVRELIVYSFEHLYYLCYGENVPENVYAFHSYDGKDF
ncbi:Methyl-accepting chemotaxis protein (MCP) signalling domain-containing protein [Brevinema andersonii]|uniref:Methyl-accepting chemotaxis protein (MCP) signalling domain-containing protein n=1 Tax=Brevinema andersonii TaxID=34097 RepID=A0A1I1D1K7_BREAD|nr:methyl-accepting chemotaxis protein [Brevinema andersonii]SFB68694.1 Methyl-accepting chemotaxis protein (MCP) signalling domain-containing protein [Brevinema andersonii]